MRGKGQSILPLHQRNGITPACAGKSLRPVPARRKPRDHPRMCGEKVALFGSNAIASGSPPHVRGKAWRDRACSGSLQGSPPHVRGKEQDVRYRNHGGGITPACAGKRLKRSRSTVPHAAIVPLFPSVCNKPAGSDGSPAGHDAPPFLPIENAAPASPAYNLRSL